MNTKSKPLTQKQIKNDIAQMTELVELCSWDLAIEMAKQAPHVFRYRMPKACLNPANAGQTFLNFVIESGNLEVISAFLAAGAPLEGRGLKGRTALVSALSAHAINLPKQALFNCLLDFGARADAVDDGGLSPIFTAMGDLPIQITKQLIEMGSPINAWSTTDGQSAFAVLANNALVLNKWGDRQALSTKCYAPIRLETVRLLLQQGADLNLGEQMVSAPQKLPIGIALSLGDVEFIDLFAGHGANWRAVTRNGQSMMFAAASSLHGVNWLHDKDPSLIDKVDHRGQTPLMHCLDLVAKAQWETGACQGAIALITAGADLDALSYEGVLARSPRAMIEAGSSDELKKFLRSFTCAQAAAGVLDEINATRGLTL